MMLICSSIINFFFHYNGIFLVMLIFLSLRFKVYVKYTQKYNGFFLKTALPKFFLSLQIIDLKTALVMLIFCLCVSKFM